MANCYRVSLIIKGEEKVLDEIQALFQKEIDEGQTGEHWYTLGKSLKRMGYDSDKLDWRAYTSYVNRFSKQELWLNYTAAWDPKPQVIISIRERWQVEIEWEGVDEFGQYPQTTFADLVGKYQIEDEEEGLNPFCELDLWVGEEALPVINKFYHTDCKTLQEAFDTIPRLNHSDMMELYEEDEADVEAVRAAKM